MNNDAEAAVQTTTDQPAALLFDVSQFEIEDTAVLTLKNLKGDDDLLAGGKPVTVEVYSPGSKPGVRALHKSGRASQMRLMRTMRGEIDNKDAARAEEERVEKLVGFTKSISQNFPIPPADLYANPKLNWITKQVEDFIQRDANFSKASTAP
jgi:hypothetical protein